jgi:hypothetical protein
MHLQMHSDDGVTTKWRELQSSNQKCLGLRQRRLRHYSHFSPSSVAIVATLWAAWEKFTAPVPPDPAILSLTGAGAIAVNFTCALVLAQYQDHSGSLTKAAFLSSWKDTLANVAIIAAGLITLKTAAEACVTEENHALSGS